MSSLLSRSRSRRRRFPTMGTPSRVGPMRRELPGTIVPDRGGRSPLAPERSPGRAPQELVPLSPPHGGEGVIACRREAEAPDLSPPHADGLRLREEGERVEAALAADAALLHAAEGNAQIAQEPRVDP